MFSKLADFHINMNHFAVKCAAHCYSSIMRSEKLHVSVDWCLLSICHLTSGVVSRTLLAAAICRSLCFTSKCCNLSSAEFSLKPYPVTLHFLSGKDEWNA